MLSSHRASSPEFSTRFADSCHFCLTCTRKVRRTAMTYLLLAPAMFFWGVGTSAIGMESFGWGDRKGAVALAVASIVIPALDSVFASSSTRLRVDKVSTGES